MRPSVDLITSIIDVTARTIASRFWWVEADDLRQEAWVEVLSNDLSTLGDQPYEKQYSRIYCIVRRRMTRFMAHDSNPTPTRGHRPQPATSRVALTTLVEDRAGAHPNPEQLFIAAEHHQFQERLLAEAKLIRKPRRSTRGQVQPLASAG